MLGRLWGRAVWEALRLSRLDSLYLVRRGAPLYRDGWFRSYRERRSVDLQGRPLPWFTYPAIELLRRRVRPEMRVFEYGSGDGTRWWAERVREVVAVEHDASWADQISRELPARARIVRLPAEPGQAYERALLQAGGPFQVVIIDGIRRVECARAAPGGLTPDGVVLFDDSERPEYEEGQRFLRESGFRCLELVGMSPGGAEKKETWIYYRPDNCLGI